MKDENGANGSTTAPRAQATGLPPLIEFRPWLGMTAMRQRQHARCKEILVRLLLDTWPAKYGWLTADREDIASEAAHDVMLDVHLLRLPRPSLDGRFPEETRSAAFRRRADLCAECVRRTYAARRSAAQTVPMESAGEALDVAAPPTFPLPQILASVQSRLDAAAWEMVRGRIAGVPLGEMAEEMGIDRTTAYRRLRRCREAVREATENQIFFDERCNKRAPIAEMLYEEDDEND
jgi:hypothetical protein